jgi:tetraacyldisaccharide 4'-kinase
MARARLETFFQREWNRISGWQLLLRPVSWLFGILVLGRRLVFRLGLAKTHHLPLPVLVVGNINVGGTGKTPIVIAFVEWLRSRGFQPGIVSRGYGTASGLDAFVGEVLAGTVADDPVSAAALWGDEPTMMMRRLGCPIFVGRDRVSAARAMLKKFPDINIIVTDDGLQHYALGRDVEIAVVDGSRGFGNGALLPAGPLREPVSRLFSTHAVLINGTGRRFRQEIPPAYAVSLGHERFVSLQDGRQLDIGAFRELAAGKRVHAFAGIGNPPRFFSHLQRVGITARTHAFSDHHMYEANEVRWPDADLVVTTEKDAVKCKGFDDARMWYMQVDAVVPQACFVAIAERLTAFKKSP